MNDNPKPEDGEEVAVEDVSTPEEIVVEDLSTPSILDEISKKRENIRSGLVWALIGLLAAVFGVAVCGAFSECHVAVKEIIVIFLPVVSSLASMSVAFYFKSKQD